MSILKLPNQSLRWLFAELIVVVLGVLIALAATSWYDGYRKKLNEEFMLLELSNSIEEEKSVLENRLANLLEQQTNIRSLLDLLAAEKLDEGTSYKEFEALRQYFPYVSDFANYEILKSRGFDLISNGEVRTALVEFYEWEYPSADAMWMAERVIVRDQIDPYLISNLAAHPGGGWSPIEGSSWLDNTVLKNLSITKLGRLERQIRQYERIIEAAAKAITAIDNERI